jgi:hypothetical protein
VAAAAPINTRRLLYAIRRHSWVNIEGCVDVSI